MSLPARRYQGGGLHVSASSLRVLNECGRQFYFQYLRGYKREQISSRMVLGTAVHAALELFYRALMIGDAEPELKEMETVALEKVASEASGRIPIVYDEGEGVAELEAEARRVLQAFIAKPYRPTGKVLGVEVPFGLGLVDELTGEVLHEEVVVGFFDLVVQDADSVVAVVDHKVTAKLAPPKSSELDVQLALYGWAGDQLYGALAPVRLRHHVLVRGKKGVRCEVVDIPRSANDAREAFEGVCAGLELVHVIVQHPRPEQLLGRNRSWRCGGCAYRARCAQPSAPTNVAQLPMAGGMQ